MQAVLAPKMFVTYGVKHIKFWVLTANQARAPRCHAVRPWYQ